MDNQIFTPPQGPPRESAPQLFEQIGLERLYEMAWRQYRMFPSTGIAAMFPADKEELKAASEKQAEFMCGVMGGPKIYIQKHGPPRMRARHLEFAIDDASRNIWLECFQKAFAECDGLHLNPEDRRALLDWVASFSAWMVNRSS